MSQRIILGFVICAACWIGGTQTAQADPLVFSNVRALQNSGSTSVALFGNPGTALQGPQITFLVDISGVLPANGTDTLLVTYTEAGSPPVMQSFQIPLFDTVHPPFTLTFTIQSPGATFQGIAGTLTFDLLNSSPDFIIPSGPNAGQAVNTQSFSFTVVQPVPEPATILMMLTGVALGVGRFKRRSSTSRPTDRGAVDDDRNNGSPV